MPGDNRASALRPLKPHRVRAKIRHSSRLGQLQISRNLLYTPLTSTLQLLLQFSGLRSENLLYAFRSSIVVFSFIKACVNPFDFRQEAGTDKEYLSILW
jgi:hypothetical protein